jgi:hypothetical protein
VSHVRNEAANCVAAAANVVEEVGMVATTSSGSTMPAIDPSWSSPFVYGHDRRVALVALVPWCSVGPGCAGSTCCAVCAGASADRDSCSSD